MLAPLVFLFLAGRQTGLEALKASSAAFHGIEVAAESRKEPADSVLLAAATRLEHDLRDWAVLEFPAPKPAALRTAGILRGKQDSVEVTQPAGFPNALLVRVALQVPGGADEAAWLYEKREGKWIRTLSLERNQQKTASQFSAIAFSPADASKSHLMVAVRTPAGSAGCWHPVSFQLYRVGTPTPPPLLLDDWHTANLCNHGPSVKSEAKGFSIEVEDRDLEPGTTRTHLLRYQVFAEHTRRVQPVAQKPREFVDEWLSRDWREAVDWTAPQARAALEKTHRELGGSAPAGTYKAVTRCTGTGKWQITLDLAGHGLRYFAVQESGPQELQMLAVGTAADASCGPGSGTVTGAAAGR